MSPRQSRSGAAANSDQQKKIIAGVVFGVLLLGVLYYELADVFFTPTPPPAAPPVILSGPSPTAAPPAGSTSSASPATPRAAATTSSAALDPTLHMQAMLITESVLYTGSGRNIFSTSAAASTTTAFTPIPKAIGPIRPSGVTPPAYTQPTGSPPLPPIDLKFFGIATRNGQRQAFLLHGDDVVLAASGDVVLRKYRIVTINANSIQIEDLTNNNKQTLPLLVTVP